MIRKVGGPGADGFPVGGSEELPFMKEAKHVKEAMKAYQGDTHQGIDLTGRLDPNYTGRNYLEDLKQ